MSLLREWGEHLTCQVDLFVREGKGRVAKPLGVTEVQAPLLPGGEVSFTYRGSDICGKVELVAPPDWQSKGVRPTVIVIRSDDLTRR